MKMPNYLQRIVMSGARTTSPAKPPAFSRALMPTISAASARMPQREEELRSAEISVDTVLPTMRASGDVAAQMAVPQTGVSHEKTIPGPEVVSGTESRREQAKGSAVDRVTPVAREVVPVSPKPAATGIRVVAPRALRQTASSSARQQKVTHVVEQTLRSAEKYLPENKLESGASVKTPLERAANAELETLLLPGRLEAEPVAVSPAPLPAKTPNLPVPAVIAQSELQENGMQTASEDASLQISPEVNRKSAEARPVGKEQNSVRPRVTVEPMSEKPVAEPRIFEERVSVPKKAVQAAVVGSTDKHRRSQISIGRIDVQVNNLPPQESTGPTPAKAPSYSNFLEVRYLDRFFLKL